jgi:isoleucyl-tRNA synthetase
VDDRIRLHLDGSGPVREAIDAHRDSIATETLAEHITVGHGAPFAGIHRDETLIDSEPFALRLEPAER